MPSYEFRALLPGKLWLISTSFRMFGVVPLNNNALIFKAPKTDGTIALISTNAPQLTPQMCKDVRGIEAETGAKLEYILGTDFHHLFSKEWAKEFPDATIYYAGPRALRMQEKEDFKKTALDRENPQLPNIDPAEVQLIPWLGFNAPGNNKPNEKRRGEFSVYIPPLKTLFMYDILVPLLPWQSFLGLKPSEKLSAPMRNFGTRAAGFLIDDPQQCSLSAKRLMELSIDILVCSHGHIDHGAVRKGADVPPAMDLLQTLVAKEA